MRVSLGRVLSWAVACDWLDKNPCAGVQLPQAPTKVQRTILKPEQVIALASKLEEPYTTLVLFLAATGVRISEAVGVQKSDFDGSVLNSADDSINQTTAEILVTSRQRNPRVTFRFQTGCQTV